MKKVYSVLIIASLMLSAFVFNSCEGDKEERYQIRVIVKNADGVRIHNAQVRLFAAVEPSLIDEVGFSNTDGEVVFNYDNKAFLDIEGRKGGWAGCNSVELLEGREVQVSVKILPPDLEEQNGCLDR